jgi:hypothetical protein
VSRAFEEFAKTQLPRHATEQLARNEIDLFRRGQRLAAGIMRELGQIITHIGLRIAVDRIVVKYANDLGHFVSSFHANRRSRGLKFDRAARASQHVISSSGPAKLNKGSEPPLIVRLTKGKRSEARLRAANYWFGPKGLIGP